MVLGSSSDVIYKEVVVIGNGPSGIALSYMLSGNLPYLVSDLHPDEMLSMRLRSALDQCLVKQDLGHLAAGLEGRSINPVSLLMDALLHPCADIGLEMEPLAEFKKMGVPIDHVVLGKGPPGGSWHRMDPYILTLSLGRWMALPGLPFNSRDSGEKRAFAYNVANYYVQYVREMGLANYFVNNAVVTTIKPLQNRRKLTFTEPADDDDRMVDNNSEVGEVIEIYQEVPATDDTGPDHTNSLEHRACHTFSSAFNYLLFRGHRRVKPGRCCKRTRELCRGQSPNRKIREVDAPQNDRLGSANRSRSISLSCDSPLSVNGVSYNLRNSRSQEFQRVPFRIKAVCDTDRQHNWLVETHNVESGETSTYACKYLVLATGASDLPNRLEFSRWREDPDWLFHDLRSLEHHLDRYMRGRSGEDVEPVLIVGAGLSAADAVIATRGRNVPVLHVFRNKSADLNKQLPENMYPEYHKVHQMMQDGRSTYPFYSAYPEYSLSRIDQKSHSVILTSKSGEALRVRVSFAAVLIGSRPDLGFLPPGTHVGVRKDVPIDCKTNTVDIDKLTHEVEGCPNMFAVGPLAGDNFVRFIPGGALAVVAELYKRNNYTC